jgi:hypothetical protein
MGTNAMTRITLTRKAARIKLAAAARAVYYIQVGEGDRHTKDVSVADMMRAFETDDRCRLRIRLSDSQHTITITNSPKLRSGYEVQF